jgi:hypothetical protein
MRPAFVRYTIHAERLSENDDPVHGVCDELRAGAPAGFRSATCKLADGLHVGPFRAGRHLRLRSRRRPRLKPPAAERWRAPATEA